MCIKNQSEKLVSEKAKCLVVHEKYKQLHQNRIQKAGNFYKPEKPILDFHLGLRDTNGVSPEIHKVVQLPNLCEIFHDLLSLSGPQVRW
ncbi:rCG23310 [Rattus norvegicus]|uniref:RCG23310 n=1 Tax=Rattus norvegicus TaxID=10116 RepID=A6JPZ9_RAT|nr:rCG23310 [Rattus norvegicus]